ncbi:tRNA (cytosine(34)-C(5))-methyltransferase Nsun2 [Megachile rotundata]|uniref:tRNA (cytosine(34)-C(5))-methyltransferase Nsun2 n=1 Tax=Megachile rotundata TaxID=143995 RepID=UPI000614B290|nr:PREDICTED: tRNA (cytosine(34)-C(5))-methyltransferase [Megachile rotundata]
MGKGRRHKPKKSFAEKRREKQKKKDEWNTTMSQSYADIVRENKDFENYYKTQKIVPEDQWNSFMSTMKENLPVAFRITGSKGEARVLLETIKSNFFKEILNMQTNESSDKTEEPKQILKCIPFYPDELAWQLQLTRKDIRRSEAYFKLHNFLIVETDCGSISRQEVVSMVPPLVLDVKPYHKVLDMCAAPGSKTAQLIEMIHSENESTLPGGFVIANDLDNNRCYMLVHQAKRLNSPSILITNYDASVLPRFTIDKTDGSKQTLKFDRILADVPCSGDGTMRKNPDIWCKWSPANGNHLHGIQYRIARRGLELLAVGGRMVYSTCSLNPIENEAVLHRLLLETQDSVQLVDCRDLVPGLVCNPGVSSWIPASKNLQYYKSWEDVPEQWQTQIRPQMFPPKPEDASKFHLDRCIRILPHHQDTGGFFVAILEKVAELPWESELGPTSETVINSNSTEDSTELNSEQAKTETANNSNSVESSNALNSEQQTKTEVANDSNLKEDDNEMSLEEESIRDSQLRKRLLEDENKQRDPRRKRKKYTGYKEDPFVFFKDDQEDVWLSIKKFYDISDELDPRCLLVRCLSRKKKNIYYTSPEIRNVVISNEGHIKLINTGVKAFVRCENKNMGCPFRLAHEGLQCIIKYIGDSRKIKVTKDDLTLILQNFNPHTPPEVTKLDAGTQERLRNFAVGSCILIYEESEAKHPYPLKLQIVGWRGTMSLKAYISRNDAIHYLRLLGVDCSQFEKNKFKENRESTATELNSSGVVHNVIKEEEDNAQIEDEAEL